jgi:hypothetical protein
VQALITRCRIVSTRGVVMAPLDIQEFVELLRTGGVKLLRRGCVKWMRCA